MSLQNNECLNTLLAHFQLAQGAGLPATLPQVRERNVTATTVDRAPPNDVPSSPAPVSRRITPPKKKKVQRPQVAQRAKLPVEKSSLLGATINSAVMQMLDNRVTVAMLEPFGDGKKATSHKSRFKNLWQAMVDVTPEEDRRFLNVMMVPQPGNGEDHGQQERRNEFLSKSKSVVSSAVVALHTEYQEAYLDFLEESHRQTQLRKGETPKRYLRKKEVRVTIGKLCSMVQGAQKMSKDRAATAGRSMTAHYTPIPRRPRK